MSNVTVKRCEKQTTGIKGQLISKVNCQAVNCSKTGTNEFVFTTMQHVFVCYFGRNLSQQKDISKLTDL